MTECDEWEGMASNDIYRFELVTKFYNCNDKKNKSLYLFSIQNHQKWMQMKNAKKWIKSNIEFII